MARNLKVKYESVNNTEWSNAASGIRVAAQSLATAKTRMEAAREVVKDLIKNSDAKSVECDGIKFSFGVQTKKSLDKKAFAQKHPNIDLNEFYVEGAAFEVLRIFGGGKDGSGDLDDQLVSLYDSLVKFIENDAIGEVSLSQFDKLRNDTELYLRALQAESVRLENTLKMAHKALASRIGQIELPTASSVKADK